MINSEEELTLFEKIPKRYVTVLILCMIVTHGLSSRSLTKRTLSLVEAPTPTNKSNTTLPKQCSNLHREETPRVFKGPNYNFTKNQKKSLTIFYDALYIPFQIVCGYICDRFSKAPRYLILFSVVVTTVYYLVLHSIVLASEKNFIFLQLLESFLGLGNAQIFPASTVILSHWAPPYQRSFLCATVFACFHLGNALGNIPTQKIIIHSGIWSLPSYIAGGFGLVICWLWYRHGYATPYSHPTITTRERIFLDKTMKNIVYHGNKPVPVLKILTSSQFWAVFVGSIGYHWNTFSYGYFMIFNKTNYLLNANEQAVWMCKSLIGRVISTILCGFVSDYLVDRGYTDVISARMIFTNIGIMGPPVFFLADSFAGCDKQLAQVFTVTAILMSGCVFVGIRIVPMDLSPNYCGFMTGCISTVLLLRVFADKINSLIIKEFTTPYMRTFSLTCFALSAFSGIFFIAIINVRTQKWNTPVFKPTKE